MPDSDAGTQARVVADRYRLVRELGRGGMGVVWLAEDQLVGRQVAVKELRPPGMLTAAEQDTYRQRALSEARSAARIHRPGVVTLFDVLPPSAGDDAIYLVMELVEGPTLAGVIERQGPLPEATVAAYGAQLASVLQVAHQMGIVHRDIKPANIMIAAGGQVKLTDFGIAHTVGDPRLTSSGVMGTEAYAAPELFDAAPISPAVDVWSLGATLLAAVIGRSPFDRDSPAATLHAILFENIPVPRCSPALAAAIAAMLQRDPARRATITQARSYLQHAADQLYAPSPAGTPATGPATAGLAPTGPATAGLTPTSPVTAGLAPGAGGPTPPAPHQPWAHLATARAPWPPQPWAPPLPPVPPAWTRRRTRPAAAIAIIAAAVVVAAAGITAAILTARHSPPSSPGTAGGLIAKFSDPDGGTAAWVAFSPDGKTLATADGTNPDAYLWSTSTRRLTATLTDPGGQFEHSVTFSPDGQTIATTDNNGSTYLWSAASHSIDVTLNDPGYDIVNEAIFSPDGNTLATSDGIGTTYLWDWNSPTHAETASIANPGSGFVNSIAFSPDGKTVAIGSDDGSTYLWSTATRKITATLTDPSPIDVNSVAFSPDGTTLATGDGNGNVYLWSTATHSLIATLSDSDAYVNSIAFSRDGKTLAVGSAFLGSIYLWSTATRRRIGTLTDPDQQGVNSVAFSPDGHTLATVDMNGNIDLWRVPSGS